MTSFYPFGNQAGNDFPWWALFEDDEDQRRPGQSCSAAARRPCRQQEPQPSTSAAAYGPKPTPRTSNPNPNDFMGLANAFLPGIFEAVSAAAANSNNNSEPSQGSPKSADEFLSTAAAFASTYFPDLFDAVTGTVKNHVPKASSASLAKPSDKAFEVKLNVSEFSPSELSVKTVDRSIVIEGRHEEKEDGQGFIQRTFVRRFVIPDGVKPENVDCKLTSDGLLVLSAPLIVDTPVTTERTVPITLSSQPAAETIPETSSTATIPDQPKGDAEAEPQKPIVEDLGDEDTTPVPMSTD